MNNKKQIVCILLLMSLAELMAAINHQDDNSMFRLPEDLVPDAYYLSLFFGPIENVLSAYNGNTNITFHLADETLTVEYIYLHADTKYVTIKSAILNGIANCPFESLNDDIIRMSCGNITEKSNYLYIEFDGQYSQTDGFGLVRNNYLDQGRKQFLVESYFEPTYARRSFPCFDEPDLTAIFFIEITCPKEYTAISSTNKDSSNTSGAYTTTSFLPTPKISTYLVSIFISKFEEFTYTSVEEGYNFKFLTRPSFVNLTKKVAGNVYKQIIESLTDFTNQTFEDTGDTECYQVAVPDCYSDNIGNYGIFVYREVDLLDEGDKTSAKIAQNIIETMSYKLSHQWFGGEISTKWWSDFWANEALPVYFKYIISNKIEEEFEILNQFVVEVVQKSMQYDAMPFIQPLSSKESDIDDSYWKIENKLEQRSLIKGASLLHMVNYMLRGEDNFKENIQYHLQNRKNSDTSSQETLKDLTKSDGIQDLYSACEPWIFEFGFPIITVSIANSTEETESLMFSQKRFYYPVDNLTTTDDIKWTIPISTTSSTSRNFNTTVNVFYAPNIELYIKINKDDWVIFNLQGRFHYRVNYNEELWKRLIVALKNDRTEIHTLNRAQLIDDAFNIARTGEVDYTLAFELAESFIDETEYYPWYSIFNAFSYLLGKMKDDKVEEKLKTYILNVISNIIDIPDFNLNTNDEIKTHIDILKQVLVLDWACKLGHVSCIDFATKQFSNFKNNQSSIEDYNFRPTILCNGIRYSQNLTNDWNFLWKLYLSSSSVHEQHDILKALGCAEDAEILKSYLRKMVTPTSDIKKQDSMFVFESVFSSQKGVEAVRPFLGISLSYLQLIFNGATDKVHVISDMILSLSEKLHTNEQLDWLQTILDADVLNGFPDLKSRAKTLATINNYWTKQYQDIIANILPDISTSTSTELTSTTQSTTESSTESTVTDQPTTEVATTTEPSTTTESSVEKIFTAQIVNALYIVVLRIVYQELIF